MRNHFHRQRVSHKHGISVFGNVPQPSLTNSKYSFVKDENGKNYRVGNSKAADKWLDELGVKIREKVISAFGKTYIIDGFDPQQNILYEYNGERWHGSHRAFPINRDLPIKQLGKTPNQLYNATVERYKFLKAMGFKIFFVWEADYQKGFMGRFYQGNNDTLY